MSNVRKVAQIIKGTDGTDGAGVKLVRLFGQPHTASFDPFLMMDGFDSVDPADYQNGFPWHPHRGIETVTYIMEGNVEHQDSLGNKGVINSGDAQWMTAGSGIIHQEMPKQAERMHGIQLWLNLPRKHKMTKPAYGDILHHNIPVVNEAGSTIKVIAGDYKTTKGAFAGKYVAPCFLDVELAKGANWELQTPSSHTLFVYILEGSVDFAGTEVTTKQVALFEKVDIVQASAGEGGARFLLLHAEPIGEAIAWGGPIVMNTEAELHQAFAELRADTFIKHD